MGMAQASHPLFMTLFYTIRNKNYIQAKKLFCIFACMKPRIFLTALTTFLSISLFSSAQTDFDGVKWQDIKLDYSSLTAENHPRLFLDNDQFKALKRKAAKVGYMSKLHSIIMNLADETLNITEPLTYKKDASGKRILKVSNEAFRRIACLSYAYRFTGRKTYLNKAEWYINTVCDFKDWNASHFLDPSDMAMGVAIGYDWLYGKLKPQTKAKAVKKMCEYAMEEAVHGQGQHIFKRPGNWNQVCNACMTAAAIATFESNPALSDEVIRRAIESNIPAAKAIYSPDGAFPEGPGYWTMGNSYQQFLILLWEGAFGSDFGISKIEGFSKTGLYKTFTVSGAGHVFNYSDSSDALGPSPAVWYFAWKFNNPGILYDEVKYLDGDQYAKDRRLILAVIMASRLEADAIEQPKDRLFVANGKNPVLMAKSGWGGNDLYLGLKGGTGSAGHSHLDVGSFVFDAYGTRWVADYYRRDYQRFENMAKELKLAPKAFSHVDDNSARWELFMYNNRQHSTLTVNDHNHKASGFAAITESFDTPERLGGTIDLTSVLAPDLKSASRTAVITDGSALEITDCLTAPGDTPAHIRWTLITPVKVRITADGIELNDGKTVMVLKTDAPDAVFRTWSSDPKDYPSRTAYNDLPLKKHTICGFEFDIKEGDAASIKTTITKK